MFGSVTSDAIKEKVEAFNETCNTILSLPEASFYDEYQQCINHIITLQNIPESESENLDLEISESNLISSSDFSQTNLSEEKPYSSKVIRNNELIKSPKEETPK